MGLKDQFGFNDALKAFRFKQPEFLRLFNGFKQ